MKIFIIALAALTNASLFQFFGTVIKLMQKLGVENLKIADVFNKILMPAFNNYDIAHKFEADEERGRIIIAKNKERITLANSIFRVIKAHIDDLDDISKAAALKMMKLYTTYKGFYKKTVNEQSAEITNMLQSSDENYPDEIKTLNLEQRFAKLKTINSEVIALIGERTDEKTKREKINISDAKKELISAFRTTIKLIDVNILIYGEELYEDFILTLNTIIKEYGGHSPSTGKTDQKLEDKPSEIVEEEPKDEEEIPLEDKFPDAVDWDIDHSVQNSSEGAIYFIIRDGIKTYYKLLDRYKSPIEPGTGRDEAIWEKL
jgi:hypothetical protein